MNLNNSLIWDITWILQKKNNALNLCTLKKQFSSLIKFWSTRVRICHMPFLHTRFVFQYDISPKILYFRFSKNLASTITLFNILCHYIHHNVVFNFNYSLLRETLICISCLCRTVTLSICLTTTNIVLIFVVEQSKHCVHKPTCARCNYCNDM